MNRLVALDNYKRTSDASKISPMVISGTHALDIVMWMMEAKKPVEIYARSVDKALGPLCKGIDATAGVITFEDGSLYHAAIISTDEHLHVEPVLAACERGLSLLIEKPLATELSASARVLEEIQKAKVDAVVGYTQRFRRRWLAAKEKVRTGSLGDVTLVT
ncbi:MAG: Gfo/Idh/MocA family oxidoreductase, partial [Betaproteobacteria bacterium]